MGRAYALLFLRLSVFSWAQYSGRESMGSIRGDLQDGIN